ncbi:Histone acetyltransferase type B catalytic subunit [Fulvia fulva]|uniref:Histone acetyltransferase type B catalytic subunit n=1 Tax=Passalora fulva TaxID=5499 RepID=A0A9Q8P9K4_PASFU|nr:Histone acetyltransferase type B catalytic subunit [Fulvia fulva]KAK4624281.1 Histone acetyltransferase type B catalytic subunit [Fulvia fulva]KAK4625815.1 Histone acetyltransferase type B catalytic subunit [Fulvia fulva]UJO18152.1 Histone acetyltransferase type B catalytic subunit [Fulvia fulva]WPV14873.1 Histone acetyltransferase type B catalytic subunit [Fulvia fulva]WPV30247.1 Histone acetyltransferase type B catalytic subunit [Fulvia fulva]
MRPTSETVDEVDEMEEEELDEEIQAQVNEWSSNSSDSFTIQLLRGGKVAAAFQPEFTYAIFGEQESIFGYQGLDISLTLRAHDLHPRLKFKASKTFPAQGEVRPTDIEEALRDFLPAAAFEDNAPPEQVDFQPPGDKIHEYKRNGKTYQVWCASLADSRARQILENMQILATMFIDGGTILELEQDWTTARWKLFLTYQVDQGASSGIPPYQLIGYGTSYRTFTFPDRLRKVQFDDFSPSSQPATHFLPLPDAKPNEMANRPDFESPLELPSRERLSQFLVLPPFHGVGHGEALYNTMFQHLTAPSNVREFTVEDPNEKFDDLRDFCDLLYLRRNVAEFRDLRVNPDVPEDKLSATQNIPTDLIVPGDLRKIVMREHKIMPRQFDRLVEMHTLSFIPPLNRSRSRITKKEKVKNENDRAYFFWRLYAKQRLYIFNADQLKQVEHSERVEKLESALDSVLEAYTQMIEKVEKREDMIESGEFEDNGIPSADSSFSKRKRAVVADDEDEDGEPGAVQERSESNGHKKVRVD